MIFFVERMTLAFIGAYKKEFHWAENIDIQRTYK